MSQTPTTDPSFTHGGYDFWIADRGQNKPGIDSEYSHEAAALNLTLRVPWDLRWESRRALLGGTEYIRPAGSQFGHLSRTLPHRYEDEEDYLWCKRVTVNPEIADTKTGIGTGPGAKYALLGARYETRPYELLGDGEVIIDGFPDESGLQRFISRPPPRSKSRVLSTKGAGWRFTDQTTPIPTPIGIAVNEMEQTLIWHQVPLAYIPIAAIESLWSYTNSAAFNGWSAGKLVFADYSFKECPRIDSDGIAVLAVDVHYTFIIKPRGANKFPDPNRGHRFYEVIAFDGSGNKPHPSGDFRSLFRPVEPS